jgi:hypothetical protein
MITSLPKLNILYEFFQFILVVTIFFRIFDKENH